MPGPNRHVKHRGPSRSPRRVGSPGVEAVPAEAYIGRKVAVERLRPEWGGFLDRFGKAAERSGVTEPLGSLVMHHVAPQDFTKLLREKYSGMTSHISYRKVLMGILNEFKDFRTQRDARLTKVLMELDDAELCAKANKEQQYLRGPSFMDATDASELRVAKNKKWLQNDFSVRGVQPYGGGDLGFELTEPVNLALREEREEIVHEFLGREQGLPVHILETGFDPHILFFRYTQPASIITVPGTAHPGTITLEKPKMIVGPEGSTAQ